jgi:hypothetical protein
MGRVVGWIVVAIAAVLVIVFFALVLQGGSCNDGATGGADSACNATGPAVGVGGMWVISVIGIAVFAVAIWRAVAAARTRAADNTESVPSAAEGRR